MPSQIARLSLLSEEIDVFHLITRFLSDPQRDSGVLRNIIVRQLNDAQDGRMVKVPRSLLMFRHNKHRRAIHEGMVQIADLFKFSISHSDKAIGPDWALGAIFDDMQKRDCPYECFGPFKIGNDRYDLHFVSGPTMVARVLERVGGE